MHALQRIMAMLSEKPHACTNLALKQYKNKSQGILSKSKEFWELKKGIPFSGCGSTAWWYGACDCRSIVD